MRQAQPHCLYPAELVSYLWQFKHPSFNSCGVERNRWGDRARESVGLPPHGTVWFATAEERSAKRGRPSGEAESAKTEPYIVPANCVPFETVVPSTIDPYTGRKVSDLFDVDKHRFKRGLMRGWRDLFTGLAKDGCFEPSEELSFLIGADSRALVPRYLWL